MNKQGGDTPMTDWVTTAQAGEILGITPRHVNRLIAAGVLEGFKMATRMMLVKRDSLANYTRNCPKGDNIES